MENLVGLVGSNLSVSPMEEIVSLLMVFFITKLWPFPLWKGAIH